MSEPEDSTGEIQSLPPTPPRSVTFADEEKWTDGGGEGSFGIVLLNNCWCLLEEEKLQQWQQQQTVESHLWERSVCHVTVVRVAAVNSDPRCSVSLAGGLAAERLVGAGLHHPT